MVISTVNKYNTHTINKRRAEKEDFALLLSEITNVEEIKEKVRNSIENKGRVYGIYRKKELVGVYIFERLENYFVKNDDASVVIGGKKINFEGAWLGESSAAFRLTDKILRDEVREYEKKIEKDIRADLSEQISFGQIAGVEWGDELIYRRQLEKKSGGIGCIWGYIGGFALGMYMGWMLFKSFLMGLCFGVTYASLWGGVAIATSKSKTEWASYDFVNKEYHSENEIEKD
ncbi:MAG: hypothetical protein HDT13_01960 [Butyrivibrio sp.]|nr:hypothetical protein [Butyrivibrio sp.]